MPKDAGNRKVQVPLDRGRSSELVPKKMEVMSHQSRRRNLYEVQALPRFAVEHLCEEAALFRKQRSSEKVILKGIERHI